MGIIGNEKIITRRTIGKFKSVFCGSILTGLEKCVQIPGISDHEAIYGEIYLEVKILYNSNTGGLFACDIIT